MAALGELKARAAAPLLFEISRTSSMFAGERWPAAAAVANIIDLETSVITCPTCGMDNPVGARFCHACADRVVSPVASPREIEELIALARHGSGRSQLQSIQKLGQLKTRKAVPVMVSLLKKRPKQLNLMEEILIVEALMEIGDLSIGAELERVEPKTRYSVPHYAKFFARLGRPDLAAKCIKPWLDPGMDVNEDGTNLELVLLAGEMGGAEIVRPLLMNFGKELGKWSSNASNAFDQWRSMGYFVAFAAVALKAVSNQLERTAITSAKQNIDSLMIKPEAVKPQALAELPGPARQLVAAHCYSTALANIAARDPTPVIAEFKRQKFPDVIAMIGLALALAGVESVIDQLDQLRVKSFWPTPTTWLTRVFAYEGLVVLNAKTRQPPQNVLAGLADKDARVRTAVAQVMAMTGNPAYAPHLLALADHPDKNQRRIMIDILLTLAVKGYRPAASKLQQLAANDPDEETRRLAETTLQSLAKR